MATLDIYSKGQVDTLLSAKADTTSLATVATTGDYDDLLNKPTIPAAQIQSDWTQADNTKVDFIKNKPTLATVATSGSYADLSNKPTIPTITDNTTYYTITYRGERNDDSRVLLKRPGRCEDPLRSAARPEHLRRDLRGCSHLRRIERGMGCSERRTA